MQNNIPTPLIQEEMDRLKQQMDALLAQVNGTASPEASSHGVSSQRFANTRVEFEHLWGMVTVLGTQLYMFVEAPEFWVSALDPSLSDDINSIWEEDFLPNVSQSCLAADEMYHALPSDIKCYKGNIEAMSQVDALICVFANSLRRLSTVDIINFLPHAGFLGDRIAEHLFNSTPAELNKPDTAFKLEKEKKDRINRKRKAALMMINRRIEVFVESGLLCKSSTPADPVIPNPQIQEQGLAVFEIVRPENQQKLPF